MCKWQLRSASEIDHREWLIANETSDAPSKGIVAVAPYKKGG